MHTCRHMQEETVLFFLVWPGQHGKSGEGIWGVSIGWFGYAGEGGSWGGGTCGLGGGVDDWAAELEGHVMEVSYYCFFSFFSVCLCCDCLLLFVSSLVAFDILNFTYLGVGRKYSAVALRMQCSNSKHTWVLTSTSLKSCTRSSVMSNTNRPMLHQPASKTHAETGMTEVETERGTGSGRISGSGF